MRTFIACALLLVACGGSQKKADTDVNSLGEPGAGGGGGDMSTSNESTGASGGSPAGGTSGGSGTTSTSTASTASAAPAASSAAASAPAVFHPKPSTNGTIDGRSFAPRIAVIASPIQKDGRAVVTLAEADDCVSSSDAKPGDATMTMTIPWKDGMKADLAAMLRPKGKGLGEISFVRVTDAKQNDGSKTFDPIGTVTVVKAPTQKDAFGKMKIDLTAGGYMLAGDIDVKVCVAPK